MRIPSAVPWPGIGLVLVVGCGAGAPQPPLPDRLDQVSEPVAELVQEAAEAVRTAPGDAQAWARLAQVYEANLLTSYAETCYRELLALEPESAQWWHRLAVVQAATGAHREALQSMRRSLDLLAYPPSYWKLGTWLLEDGELEAARAVFEEATRKSPRYPGGWAGLARVHLQSDRPEEAIRAIQTVLRSQPDPYARQLLGAAYRQSGRTEAPEAQAAWDTSREPSWPDPWQAQCQSHVAESPLRRARRLQAAGRPEEAVEVLEAVAAGGPDAVRALSILADVHYKEGDTARALAAFERILELEPRNTWTWINISRIHQNAGDLPRAIETLDRAIRLHPDYGTLHATKGQLLFATGQYEAAAQSLHSALDRDDRNVETRTLLGQSLNALGRWEEARGVLLALLDETYPPPQALLALAQAHLQLGELEQAQTHLQRAASLGRVDAQSMDDLRRELEEALAVAGSR